MRQAVGVVASLDGRSNVGVDVEVGRVVKAERDRGRHTGRVDPLAQCRIERDIDSIFQGVDDGQRLAGVDGVDVFDRVLVDEGLKDHGDIVLRAGFDLLGPGRDIRGGGVLGQQLALDEGHAHVDEFLPIAMRCVEVVNQFAGLHDDQLVAVTGNEGRHVGLVAASQLLQRPPGQNNDETLKVVVIRERDAVYGIAVERFIGERTLVVLPLDDRLGKVQDISAGALLDDGSVVLIVDVEDMLRSVDKLLNTGRLERIARRSQQATEAPRKRVLVVDDSLTVRELQRKLLLNRGYEVAVAVDGMDGWNALRSEDFDLLITDIDMPRMDGIELVTLLRRDSRLQSLPVMVVSYKDREEDRRRGLDAGADYYLAKASFHDDALLDAVVELIGGARA